MASTNITLSSMPLSRVRHLLPKLKPESDELLHLDALRIFASLAVVITHFREALFAAFTNADRFERLVHPNFGLAVDMFFAISGFVIAWAYGNRITSFTSYLQFLKKRIARLAPLHWATTAFFVLIGVLALWTGQGPNNPEKYEWSCLPSTIFLIQAWIECDNSFNSVAWSISAEMAMYILFPILYAIVLRAPKSTMVLIIVLFALGVSASIYKSNAFLLNGAIRRALQGFLYGLLLFQYKDLVCRIPFSGTLMLVSLIAFFFGCAYFPGNKLLILPIFAIVACAVARDISGKDSSFIRMVAPFGQLTYSLYMLHPIVHSIGITLIGRKMMHLSGIYLSAFTFFCIITAFFISYVSFFFFETPARHAISNRRSKNIKQK